MTAGGGTHSAPDGDAVWAPPPAPGGGEGPSLLAGYSGFTEIAHGGDSVIYRATQDALGRLVAVKAVELADPSMRARFDRELQITLGLGRQHPHVVTVLDTGETTDGRAAIVMEFYELGSLHDRLVDHGPLPVVDALRVSAAVADALAFAHQHGVLHRDVKPQNVLALPTTYVLADFGIARMADAGHTASLERFSYRHASPQVLDGQVPSVADDVWSFGSTVFTVLEGRTPFSSDREDEDTALGYIGRVRRGERRTWRRDEVPAAFRALVDRCLAPVAGDRPAEMATVLAEVEAISASQAGWGPGAPAAVGPPSTSAASTASTAPASPSTPVVARALAQDDVDPVVASAPVPAQAVAPSTPPPSGVAASAGATTVDPRAERQGRVAVETRAATAPATADAVNAATSNTATDTATDTEPEVDGRTGAQGQSAPSPTVAGPAAQASPASAFAPSSSVPTTARPADEQPPLAKSALAHDPGPGLLRDAEPTGRADDVPTDPSVEQEDGGRLSKRWRIMAFVVAALLLGITGGLLSSVLGRDGDEQASPPPAPTTTGQAVPTVTVPSQSVTVDPDGSFSDEASTPGDFGIVDQGSSLRFAWTDPTEGQASFLLVDVTGGQRIGLRTMEPGTTTVTLEGIDADAPQLCYQLVAVVPSTGKQGSTAPTCVRG